MITLGTAFEAITCPKCKNQSIAIIRTEVYNYGTRIRKSVLDACPKCGIKLSKQQEFDRDLSDTEIDKLYPNGKTKLQITQL